MNDLREFVRILMLCVLASVAYGIVHDQFTAHLCAEYFTVAHPPVFATTSPWLQGLGWGVIATWWVGAILGVLLGISARMGGWYKFNARELVRPVLWLMAVTALVAAIGGVTGYWLFKAHRVGIAGWESEIAPAQHAAFSADMWSHLASYAMGFLGGLFLCARTLWLRWRLSQSGVENMKRSKFRRLALAGGIAIIALLGLRLALFHGPYQAPSALPPAKFLDVHCHTAGIGAGASGCFVSRELEQSYKFGIYLKAFGVTREELAREGDTLIVRRISEQLAGSSKVGRTIILALDGVADAAGELDRTNTQVYVPNEFVAAETAKFTNLLWGASINPYRKDALARLDWAAAHGAKLVKWIPGTMHIDPADERIAPFYRRMVELKLPLLCHAGQERSFIGAQDELADPLRLELPLKLGVTVIAAHIASTGKDEGERDTDRLARLMAAHTNLYSEISSLTQANKLGYLREALTRPEFRGRLLYGTDFPLINTALVSPWYYPLNLTRAQMARIAAIQNPWDRDVALKQALGVPPEIFTRTESLFTARP